MSHAAPAHPVSRMRPFADLRRPVEVVQQFTPNWFAVCMGTGILALALAQFPVRLPTLHAVAVNIWLFDAGLFSLFAALYAARWLLYPEEARRILSHPVASMFLGCIPMALATIVNGLLAFGPAAWGQTGVHLAEALWWADVVMALACGLGVPFAMFTRQSHSVEQMTAVWLLPVVASEVAAVTGGLLAPHLAEGPHQLLVVVASLALWACSVPLALGILVILVLRLALHKLPHPAMAATSWLALGPIGTGSLGLLVLGPATARAFASCGLAVDAAGAEAAAVVGGILLWGYGLWWAAMAAMITVRYLRQGLPFNLGWWGYTFPIGVYAVATLKLAQILPIPALRDLGGALVVLLVSVWVVVVVRTLPGAWRGNLFAAPRLQERE